MERRVNVEPMSPFPIFDNNNTEVLANYTYTSGSGLVDVELADVRLGT